MINRVAGRLNRLQKSRGFKIAASIAVALVVIAAFWIAWVAANEPEAPRRIAEFQARQQAHLTDANAPRVTLVGSAINSVLVQFSSSDGATAMAVGFGAVLVGAIAVIWLGLGITYLATLLIAGAIAAPLASIDATAGLGRLVMAVVPLALAFLTLLELMRVALGASNPIAAIARNVLNEAVRMKISIVFIVMLLLLLAVVPGALNADQPLRYRVQQWLQYGVGFSYTVMVLLTAFLSVGTVVFEQRDRIVWQTATKPVRAWQYILGKWCGVMCLNAVLLAVSAGGVYLFTEYLRHQPAKGESGYFVDERGNSTRGDIRAASTDRRILETEVLVARVGAEPEPFRLTDFNVRYFTDLRLKEITDPTPEDRRRIEQEIRTNWEASIKQFVDAAIENRTELGLDAETQVTDAVRARIRKEVLDRLELEFRSIEPGAQREFLFNVEAPANRWYRIRDEVEAKINRITDERLATPEYRGRNREEVADAVWDELLATGAVPEVPELTLRYKVQAGSNDPSKIYRIYLVSVTPGDDADSGPRYVPIETTLNTAGTYSFPAQALPRDGRFMLGIASDPTNDRTITLPPDGLEILHTVGGYETNFVRVMAALWIKLGFIAAVGISAATFLSFPVSALFTLGVVFMAESAAFLADSLEFFAVKDREGAVKIGALISRAISWPIAKAFEVYANLRPTTSLVDGRLVAWSDLAFALGVIGAWTVLALTIGVLIYRRRELALYSGQ